jgi:hypothetical protein
LDPVEDAHCPVGNALTMAKEGPYLASDPESFCQWYAQSLHELVLYMWSRVSKDFKPHIDPTQSIPTTSVEIDGKRIHLQPWSLVPDRLGDEPSGRVDARKAAAEQWRVFCSNRAKFHPVLGRKIQDVNEACRFKPPHTYCYVFNLFTGLKEPTRVNRQRNVKLGLFHEYYQYLI